MLMRAICAWRVFLGFFAITPAIFDALVRSAPLWPSVHVVSFYRDATRREAQATVAVIRLLNTGEL